MLRPFTTNNLKRAQCSHIQEVLMNKRTLITTAAAIFAASTFATAAYADGVKCGGANACKGQSACKGGTASPGKGQNACKGQGFTEAKDTAACTAAGGKVL
jgi:hypothetical protein